MKKKKSVVIALSALAFVLSAVSVASFARANDDSTESSVRPKMEQRDEMREAVENGDFAKWKETVESKPKVTDYITEENFSKFSEMHKLMRDGNREEAEKIREELGLPDKGMRGPGGKGKGRGMHREGFIDKDGDGQCDRRQE
ncbi:hypothetical protein KKH43_02825 [Patescibacteria group bacterium]|nr:hypothetical protein [Patescibacteria group bacterium]